MSSFTETLFAGLHLAGVMGGCYTGYKLGPYIKGIINTPAIKPYKDRIGFVKHDWMNEDRFCALSGSLIGAFVGRMFWPVTIPISLLIIERYHGPAIRKLANQLKTS